MFLKDSRGLTFSTNMLITLFMLILVFGAIMNIIDISSEKTMNSLEVQEIERITNEIVDILIKYNNSVWDKPLYDSNSPYWVATAQSKPTIILHGNLDVVVPLYQSQWLRGRLNTLGVPNEYYEYFDGHGFNYTNTSDAMDKTVAFLKNHLQ